MTGAGTIPGEADTPPTGGLFAELMREHRAPHVPGYEVLRVLGDGGQARVYHARSRDGREVAIKRWLGAGAVADVRERIRREAEALEGLEHPGLVRLIESTQDAQGEPCLVLELVDGTPLDAVIRQAGRLDPARAAQIGVALADALEHLHGRGLLHRDVKPANVVLRASDQQPVLIDLGIVCDAWREPDALTLTGERVIGSFPYMAPEQLGREDEAEAVVDARTDVYGLGAMLFEALTGFRPWTHQGPWVRQNRDPWADPVHRQVLQRARGVPAALRAVVGRCLRGDPAERYASARALRDALAGFLAGEELTYGSAGEPRPRMLTVAWIEPGKGKADASFLRRVRACAELSDGVELGVDRDAVCVSFDAPSSAVAFGLRLQARSEGRAGVNPAPTKNDTSPAAGADPAPTKNDTSPGAGVNPAPTKNHTSPAAGADPAPTKNDTSPAAGANPAPTKNDTSPAAGANPAPTKNDTSPAAGVNPAPTKNHTSPGAVNPAPTKNDTTPHVGAGFTPARPARREATPLRIALQLGEVIPDTGSGALLVTGPAVDEARLLADLALPGQLLMSAAVFNLARAHLRWREGELAWQAYGPYQHGEDVLEVCEAGAIGRAPLQPPPDSRALQRAVAPGQEAVLGWRPARGLSVPTRPNWNLARKLGEGGFGEVWLAVHASTRDQRAFKFCFHPGRLRQLKREVILFTVLRDTLDKRWDIAQILDWQFEQAPFFIESEYSADGSFLDWAAEQGGLEAIPFEQRLELVAQVADALDAAHGVGVLHKDVKPSNVLIKSYGVGHTAQLADFGVGNVSSGRTTELRAASRRITRADLTEVWGPEHRAFSHLYTAPELIEGEAASERSDIYALGILLYQVVRADFAKALGPGWERYVDDPLLREDVAACVDSDPARRLPSGGDLARRLRSLEERRAAREADEQVTRERALLEERRALVKQRRRTLLLVLVFAALALWGFSAARSSQAEVERLRAQVRELEARER